MIDRDSPAGSWAKALADIQAMRDANKLMGDRKNESENNTDSLRKEHPLHNGRQPDSGAR